MVQKENVEVQSNQWPIKYGEHIGGDKGAKVDATAKRFENAYPLQSDFRFCFEHPIKGL